MYCFQELSVANEEQSDHTDIELIQHINLDITRYIKYKKTPIVYFPVQNFTQIQTEL